MAISKIISGGQTGVDRAALDVALELGIPIGGWCPHGRKASDGNIPIHYPLVELSSGGYRKRTEWNIRDSDATLVISPLPLSGGTLLTANLAKKIGKPLMVIDINNIKESDFDSWLITHGVLVLNVAGPSEDSAQEIYYRAKLILEGLLKKCSGTLNS